LFALGEENYKAKKVRQSMALLKQTPNDEESDLIHNIWLQQIAYHDPNLPVRKPENVRYMDQTIIKNAQIMQPQYRNRHNFMIFGGFLLKNTFELAFTCAASFAHSRPTFISLDPSTFENPVPVGSVLYLTATVAYTDPPAASSQAEEDDATSSSHTRVQVRVDSKVRDIEHGSVKNAGQFNYTFLVDKDIRVMPRTYGEFMIWVDARRRAEAVSEVVGDGPAGEAGPDGVRISGGGDDGTGERITE
jgi:acyl-coenzyme A thioesterase 9